MRPIEIRGTPPQAWLDDAQAVTKKMLEAAKLNINEAEYHLRLLPNLTDEAGLPAHGRGLLAIGDLSSRLQLRLFDVVGNLIAKMAEPKDSKEENFLASLRGLLANNWDETKLKPLEKSAIFGAVASIVRRFLISCLIDKNEKLWRDDRIRDWLQDQFNKKCWYSEAQETVSAYHVDHYRPKGRISDLDGKFGEGYWWLAFKWANYRICGQLINVKKRDVFPFATGVRSDADGTISSEEESPILIDPVTDQARLISFDRQDDGSCLAVPAAGEQPIDHNRAKTTIDILGLNRLDKLNSKRGQFWDSCLAAIDQYRSATAPLALATISKAAACSKLKTMVAYAAEFSSVAEACIRKKAPESLRALVLSGAQPSRGDPDDCYII